MSLSPNRPSLASEVEQARAEILAWLNEYEPDGSGSIAEELGARTEKARVLSERFLRAIRGCGFELEVVNVGTDREPAFDPRWTHCDNQFVGFKQPPSAPTLPDAELLACAALLRNDWCRARLPHRHDARSRSA